MYLRGQLSYNNSRIFFYCSPTSCGAGWGMFILIRSGLLIATNDRGASFSPVPYVDEHGEHDIHLVRRLQCRPKKKKN